VSKWVSKSILLAGAVALGAASGPIACSAQNTGAVAESTGTLEAALSAVGPDGATYTFESNDYFDVNSSPYNPDFNAVGFGLNGSGNITTSFPVGGYVGTLYGGTTSADGGVTVFTLVRTIDGGSSTVQATLLDSGTYPFEIVAGQTTSITIHLNVAGLGTVTFSTGTLSVGTSITQSDGGGSGAVLVGSSTVTSQTLGGPAAVQTALTTAAGSAFAYSATVTFAVPWTPEVGSVCAIGTAQMTVPAGASTGAATLLGELNGASSEVCVEDNTTGQVTVSIYRTGTPQTAALKAATTDSISFQLNSYGSLGFQAYNDTSFFPQKIASPVTLTGFNAYANVTDNTTGTTLDSLSTSGTTGSSLVVTP
jgi:hypothetical protein